MKIRPTEGNEREFSITGLWLEGGGCSPRTMFFGGKPTVIIDPEDEDRVVELWTRFAQHRLFGDDGITAMRKALLECVDPKPRIEEPTGLGAVVEDADGRLWTRVERADDQYPTRNPWYPAYDADRQPAEYRSINVARVLSEGIS